MRTLWDAVAYSVAPHRLRAAPHSFTGLRRSASHYHHPLLSSSAAALRARSYLLSKTIGEGTFGKVKLGVHLLTGERVAVKVLEKDRITDKG